MKRNEFFDAIKEQVKNISISTIIGSRLELQANGRNHLALCPFHDDKNIGSFVITESRGSYKCFACDAGGDGITFIMDYNGIEFKDAVFTIALEFDIITAEDYKRYYAEKSIDELSGLQVRKKYNNPLKKKTFYPLAEAAVLDRVYRLFMNECGLSTGHKEYLTNERKMSDEQIQRGMYFTMPTMKFMNHFVGLVEVAFGTQEILKGIPGFYWSHKTEKWEMRISKGLGISIQNAFGQIVGIQVRTDRVTKAGRYHWFTSSFAEDDDALEFGVSPGSPADVVIPLVVRNRTVIITEGRFKAEILAEKTGSVVISLQGVASWKGVADELEALAKNKHLMEAYPEGFMVYSVMTAYDADTSSNVSVFKHLKNMTDTLIDKRYPVYYLNWPHSLSKGIDDLIRTGRMAEVKRYDKEVWDNMYETMIEDLEKEDELPIMKIPKSVIGMSFTKRIKQIAFLNAGEISKMHKLLLEGED